MNIQFDGGVRVRYGTIRKGFQSTDSEYVDLHSNFHFTWHLLNTKLRACRHQIILRVRAPTTMKHLCYGCLSYTCIPKNYELTPQHQLRLVHRLHTSNCTLCLHLLWLNSPHRFRIQSDSIKIGFTLTLCGCSSTINAPSLHPGEVRGESGQSGKRKRENPGAPAVPNQRRVFESFSTPITVRCMVSHIVWLSVVQCTIYYGVVQTRFEQSARPITSVRCMVSHIVWLSGGQFTIYYGVVQTRIASCASTHLTSPHLTSPHLTSYDHNIAGVMVMTPCSCLVSHRISKRWAQLRYRK